MLLLGAHLRAEEWICIDKNNMTITLYGENDTIIHCPISCGRGYGQKQTEGDMRTPEGSFKVTQITSAKDWGHDFGDGMGYIKHAYGPWFIRLSAGHGVGIHGTHDPGSMGIRASEGCIRLRNEDLLQLKPRVQKGMRVVILADAFDKLSIPKVKMRVPKPAVRFVMFPTCDILESPVSVAPPSRKPISVNTILHIGRKKSKN